MPIMHLEKNFTKVTKDCHITKSYGLVFQSSYYTTSQEHLRAAHNSPFL